jgi:polygalacturonase
MGIAVGSEMSGSVTNVHIYNNTIGVCDTGPDPVNGCGWGPALHVKSTITRGGRIENITFDNNTVWNTSLFILVEMDYQTNSEERPPVGYQSTLVKNISFLSNRALGSATSASFACSRFDACHGVTVVNNHIVAARRNIDPWNCRFIAPDYFSARNLPMGLNHCMATSMDNISTLLLPTSIT